VPTLLRAPRLLVDKGISASVCFCLALSSGADHRGAGFMETHPITEKIRPIAKSPTIKKSSFIDCVLNLIDSALVFIDRELVIEASDKFLTTSCSISHSVMFCLCLEGCWPVSHQLRLHAFRFVPVPRPPWNGKLSHVYGSLNPKCWNFYTQPDAIHAAAPIQTDSFLVIPFHPLQKNQ